MVDCGLLFSMLNPALIGETRLRIWVIRLRCRINWRLWECPYLFMPSFDADLRCQWVTESPAPWMDPGFRLRCTTPTVLNFWQARIMITFVDIIVYIIRIHKSLSQDILNLRSQIVSGIWCFLFNQVVSTFDNANAAVSDKLETHALTQNAPIISTLPHNKQRITDILLVLFLAKLFMLITLFLCGVDWESVTHFCAYEPIDKRLLPVLCVVWTV